MNKLAKTENQLQVKATSFELTIDDIRKHFCENATDKELMLFKKTCESHNLDPWRREAYLIKYGSNPAQIVVGKDTFTRRAQQSPRFKGFAAGVIVERANQVLEVEGAFTLKTDILLGGWAQVHVDGYTLPIKAYVSMQEFGKQQSTWKQMPATMIRKVALVSALREAFPDELGGLYDSAEMGADIDAAQPKEITKPVTQTITIPKVKSITEKKEEVKDVEVVEVVEETIPESVQAEELPPFDNSESPAPIEQEKPRRGRPPAGNPESRCRKAFEVLKIASNHQERLIKNFEQDWELLLHNLNMLGQNLKGKEDYEKIEAVAKFLEIYAGEK